jgi:hypothetical protein
MNCMCIGLLNEWSHNLKFNNMFGGQRVDVWGEGRGYQLPGNNVNAEMIRMIRFSQPSVSYYI